MNSAGDTAEAVGCPIRKSTDQSLLAAPHGLSQRAASFIASQCQGIHQMPFRRLISTHECATRRRKPTRNLSTSPQPHPTKMHHHDPTDSSSVAGRQALSGHPRSLVLFTCQRSHTRPQADICVLSRGYPVAYRLVSDTLAGSLKVPVRHSALPPGGGGRDRTDDLMLAKHALSQLSYGPLTKEGGGPG